MITPKELQAKTEKAFFKIVSTHLKGENVFPWVIPSNKQISGTNYNEWKADLMPLHQQSKQAKGKGFTIDWKLKMINGIKQSIPSKIYYETFDDFLFSIGRTADYQKIVTANDLIVESFPALKDWTASNPAILLEHATRWNDLLNVCNYFVQHTPPHPFYIRELPIPVHSKFIEQNAALLKKLLDVLLPESWIVADEKDFASRFGLKKLDVNTQIRILDEGLKPYLGYDGCSLALDDAAWLNWKPQKVFIIENQICFHTFPKVENAVAIFGEGFKSRVSRHLPWLEETDLYCWFDLDAAGFEMLNMVREYYPKAKSFLMENYTFQLFADYSVYNSAKPKKLENLTEEERTVYTFLLTNKKRLEQEKISQGFVKAYIAEKLSKIF